MLRRVICSSNAPLSQPYEPLSSPMQHIPSTPPRPAEIQSPVAGELSPWPQITPDGSCRVSNLSTKDVPDQVNNPIFHLSNVHTVGAHTLSEGPEALYHEFLVLQSMELTGGLAPTLNYPNFVICKVKLELCSLSV